MKQKIPLKRFLCLLIALFLIAVIPGGSLMVSADGETTIALQKDPTPYQFQIKPGSPEWNGFTSKQEKLDVCQIPEQKLKGMTTEALLSTVLAYPLITDYFAFDTPDLACNVMSNDFNGFNELFSRSDVTQALLNRYRDARVLTKEEALDAAPETYLISTTVEYLIACSTIKNGVMSAEDSETLSALLI